MTAVEPRRVDASIRQEGIPAAARRRAGSPRQALAACVAGAAVLGLLAPPDLADRIAPLGSGPLTAMSRLVADLWEREEAGLGLRRPHHALRRATQWLLDSQWP